MHLAGDGLCVEICPSLFEMHDDGLAYVKEADWPNRFGVDGQGSEPKLQMASGLATVPEALIEEAIDAASDCPGECIFIQPDE